MTDLSWWVAHYQLPLFLGAVLGLLVGLAGHHLHVCYRISGKGGERLRCGITRWRRFPTRMREYRKGKDRGSQSWLWRRQVWCWLPLPYRLFCLFGDGWCRRAVTVQFVWGRNRVLRIEEAEIKRTLPTWNQQHASPAARARAAREAKVAA